MLRGDPAVALLGFSVVVAVAHLERLESGGRKTGDEVIHGGQTRMRHRDNAPGVAHDRNHLFSPRPEARNKCRSARAQQPREHIVSIGRVARFDQGIGDLRPANRSLLETAGFRIRSVPLEEIEKAGGSLRCCVAEIF